MAVRGGQQAYSERILGRSVQKKPGAAKQLRAQELVGCEAGMEEL